jgi:hypothetical protein
MRTILAGLLAALACAGCRSASTEPEPASKADLIARREEKLRPKDPNPPGIYDFDLNAPTDASTADLETSAKVMIDRATSYGYKGITSRVIQDTTGSRIRVSCATSMTTEMRKILRLLGVVAGQKAEIRGSYLQTKAEREQHLYSAEKNTAPQDAKWYTYLDTRERDSYVPYPRLLKNEPVLSPPDLRGPKIYPSGSITYEADLAAAEKKLASWILETFLIDGEIIEVSLKVEKAKKGALSFEPDRLIFLIRDDSGTLEHCLKYPMPLRLTPTKYFARDGTYLPF